MNSEILTALFNHILADDKCYEPTLQGGIIKLKYKIRLDVVRE